MRSLYATSPSLSFSPSLSSTLCLPLSLSLPAFGTGSICPCCVGIQLCFRIVTLFLGVIFVFIDIEVRGRNREREQKTETEVNEGYRLKEIVRTLGWNMKSNTQKKTERERGRRGDIWGRFNVPTEAHDILWNHSILFPGKWDRDPLPMVVLITGDQITQQKLPFSVSVATGRQREETGTCVVVDEHNAHRGDSGDKFREHFITRFSLKSLLSHKLMRN